MSRRHDLDAARGITLGCVISLGLWQLIVWWAGGLR
jgi:hypothetical protein